MMELVERAIPVIQHSPEAGSKAELLRKARAQVLPASPPEDHSPPADEVDAGEVERSAGIDSAVAHVYRTLDRMRSQQAQLTSGTILQQYQRQLSFEVEDSRPATKVLSVQG